MLKFTITITLVLCAMESGDIDSLVSRYAPIEGEVEEKQYEITKCHGSCKSE